MAFFAATEVASGRPELDSLSPKCGACGLYKLCKSPKMEISGDGRRGVLVIADSPGYHEDVDGSHFVGPSGQFLRKTLHSIGVDLDRDCWSTNSVICRPPDNRRPTSQEIAYCRPNALNAIRDMNPSVVLLLGAAACGSVISPLWRHNVGSVSEWAGWQIPSVVHNAWLCPTFHPNHVESSLNENKRESPLTELWFRRHLERAFGLNKKPYDIVPDYESNVECERDPNRAAGIIRKMIKRGKPIAFDYETNRLKPDFDGAEIVSCAVCSGGDKTIAYPFVGEAVKATSELLLSDVPKLGANSKFEDRWTRTILGHPVNNWKWDAMLSAHHLDNREGVTSVKFQALVRLGCPDWGSVIRPYLEQTDEFGFNKIRQVDMRTLLLYNGLDALLEYKICQHQKEEMKRGYR